MRNTEDKLHRLTIVARMVLDELNQNAHLLDMTSKRMNSACAICATVSQNLHRTAVALNAELHRDS